MMAPVKPDGETLRAVGVMVPAARETSDCGDLTVTQMLTLLTAEEYAKLDDDRPTELVRGRVIYLTQPFPLHGFVCQRIAFMMQIFLEGHDLGRVFINDTGVVTERSPDTVRGVDVAYYSYIRLPKDASLNRWPEVSPDIAFEVLSPSNRRGETLTKVGEYLRNGSMYVCVVNPKRRLIDVYQPDDTVTTCNETESVLFPDLLPGFELPVARVFA